MIQEDYVSFEIAKLLKKNGFECEKDSITAMYNELGKFHSLSTAVDEYYYDYNDFDEYDYVAPTLQMAMKWLREVYELYIEISLSCDREDKNAKIFDTSIFNIHNQRYKKLSNIQGYEEACESAIKYCLENLI